MRSTRMLIALAIVASMLFVAVPALANSWDAFNDFGSTNPSGAWSYGSSTTLGGTFVAFTNYVAQQNGTNESYWYQDIDNLRVGKDFGGWYAHPAGSIDIGAGAAGQYSICRWTAPASGTYTIKSLMVGNVWSAQYGHSAGVHVQKNGVSLLDGQSGTFEPLRNEAFVPYYGVLTLNAGDNIDFVDDVGWDGETTAWNNEARSYITIQDGSYIISGHVRDSHGTALIGAKISVVGKDDYAVTDASGYYQMSLFEGSYTLKASMGSFTDNSQPVTVSGAGSQTVDFSMANTGVWNPFNDWGVSSVVNGQWSYGYTARAGGPTNTSSFTLLPSFAWFDYGGNLVGYNSKWVWCTSGTPNWWTQPGKPWVGVDYNVNSFLLRPSDSTPASETIPVLRWTAPDAGLYSFSGTFTNTTGNHPYGYDVVKNKSTILVTNDYLSGQAPNNVGTFMSYGNFAQGETLDFVARAADSDTNHVWLYLNTTIQTGAPGFQGYVEDANHVRVVGAKVEVGTASTTTDSNGQYTLVLGAAGTYSVKASKAGLEPVTYSNVTVGMTFVTENFTLPLGAILSGNVTQDIPTAYPPVVGANIYSSDGIYITTSDTAGHYSIRVTRGSRTFSYGKAGFAPDVVTTNITGDTTQNVRLGIGWDLATDFNNQSNPNGPWSYGYAYNTAGPAYQQLPKDSFMPMMGNSGWMLNSNLDAAWYALHTPTFDATWPWGNDPGSESPVLYQNLAFTALEQSSSLWYGGPVYREARKVVSQPSGQGNVYTAARFVAPSGGFFHVTAKFAGVTQNSPYTQSKVALMYNNSYVFGGPSDAKAISGFAGRSANNYTDSAGTGTAVYTYSFDADLVLGDKIDALVLNDVAYPRYQTGGQTQVDLTISKASTMLVGRATAANIAGNPGVPNAQIILNGASYPFPSYTSRTDAQGYYAISVRPDTYTVEVRGDGYSTFPDYNVMPNGFSVTIPSGSTTTQNFQLTHSGNWSLANDFNALGNPNGQWTYGYYTATSAGGDPVGFTFTPFTSYGTIYTSQLQGWKGQPWLPLGLPGWLGWVAKNTSSAAADVLVYDQHTWVESNHISLGGGDINGLGGAAIRWTCPDNRLVKLGVTLQAQVVNGSNPAVSIFHNGVSMTTQTASGFVGKMINNYSDSNGAPIKTWVNGAMSLNSGDTLDFVLGSVADVWDKWHPCFGWPERGVDIAVDIRQPDANVHSATTIAAIKALNQGDTVILTAPMHLACSTVGAVAFDKLFGNPAVGSEYSFYIQNADRTQGIKCTCDGTLPIYDSTYSVTLTGVVDVQMAQKIIKVQAINSAVKGTAPRPLGKNGAALANNNTLVTVWGKIKSLVVNPARGADTWGANNEFYKWDYEYMIINDGSKDVKIPLHVQNNYMSSYDPTIARLAVDQFVGVTGIAGTTTGSDLAVYPRNVFDIIDYQAFGY